MNPIFFAAPALALALGFGGGAQAHLPASWKPLTEEQKVTLQEVRDLMEEGKVTEAKELAKEADLPRPGRLMHRPDHQDHHLTPENRAAFIEAIENGDYDAFVDVTADAPFADRLTEEKFDVMIEAREAFQSGDREGAHDILREADMHKPPRMRMHRFGGDHQTQVNVE